MVHQLLVPAALSCLDIERDQALAKEAVARTMAAVVVARRQLHRHVDEAELFIRGHLRPHTRIAGVGPRIVQPRVVAELAGPRDGVKDPQPPAGPHIEAPHVALDVGLAPRRAAGQMRGADHNHVVGDNRGRLPRDLAFDEIDLLIELLLQVDDAVPAEALDRVAGFGVKRHELVANGDVEDALLLAVGPVREAAARQLARGRDGALALVQAVHPQHLARERVERDGRATRARRRVDLSAHHERGRLEVGLDPGAEVIRAEPPGHLELAEVAGVDLVERRVPRAGQVAAVGPPLPVRTACRSCRGWRGGRGRLAGHRPTVRENDKRDQTDAETHPPGHRSIHHGQLS